MGESDGALTRIRSRVRELSEAAPGDRFERYARRRASDEPRVRSALIVGSGVLLVAIGGALSMLPLAPGFLLTVPGLAILAARIPTLARLVDRGELGLRRAGGSIRRKLGRAS